jgi:hypothetical protein
VPKKLALAVEAQFAEDVVPFANLDVVPNAVQSAEDVVLLENVIVK